MEPKDKIRETKEKLNEGKEMLKEKLDEHQVKEKLAAGTSAVNERIKGLGLRKIVEGKVSPETRAKFPVLNKIIPLTNYIACGLVVLLLVMVVSNIGGGGASSASDFSFNVSDGHVHFGEGVVITGYSGRGGRVVIPARISGHPVVAISANAFRGAEEARAGTVYVPNPSDAITSIVVPNGVEYIGPNAFERMDNLTSVTLPDSVRRIDAGAFSNNARLKSVNLPANSELRISQVAFSQCPQLTDLSIPRSLTSIDWTGSGGRQFMGSGRIPANVRERLRELGYTDSF